jgi:hypothetical protein
LLLLRVLTRSRCLVLAVRGRAALKLNTRGWYRLSPSTEVYIVLHVKEWAPSSLISCARTMSLRWPGARKGRGWEVELKMTILE